MALALVPGSRPRHRQSRIAERSIEAHVAVEALWRDICETTDYVELQEAAALRDHVAMSIRIARRIARRADEAALTGDAHGRQAGCGRAA